MNYHELLELVTKAPSANEVTPDLLRNYSVVICVGTGPDYVNYRVLSNPFAIDARDLALVCDEGKLPFGYRVNGSLITVFTKADRMQGQDWSQVTLKDEESEIVLDCLKRRLEKLDRELRTELHSVEGLAVAQQYANSVASLINNIEKSLGKKVTDFEKR